MCSEQKDKWDLGTPSEYLQNMRQPMPLARKIKLVLRNNAIKLRTGSTCCGNYGEPGC
jgi:hypothetical protein